MAKFVGFYGPAAFKRDLWKIALAEHRSLSVTVCALLRLGIGRYFELADANMVAPLRTKLAEVVSADRSFAEAAPAGSRSVDASKFLAQRDARRANEAAFDAAIDEGLREFAGERTTSSASLASRPLTDDYAPFRSRLSPKERWRRRAAGYRFTRDHERP